VWSAITSLADATAGYAWLSLNRADRVGGVVALAVAA
jgi:hypothetical protein